MLTITKNGIEIDDKGYLEKYELENKIMHSRSRLFHDATTLITETCAFLDKIKALRDDGLAVFYLGTLERMHKDYQSVMILLCRGLQSQARSIMRNLLEKTLILKAIDNDHNRFDLWERTQNKGRNRAKNTIKEGFWDGTIIPWIKEQVKKHNEENNKKWLGDITKMDYLYHYTNIESLAMILSNKTIRFTSLDQMDDLQEEQVADIRNIGQFCYVSSWTDDQRESIPMWKMYSSLEAGVRIRMKKYPFKESINDIESLEKTKMPVENKVEKGEYPKSIVQFSELIIKGFILYPSLQKDMLFKVEYTDDTNKLLPNIVSHNNDNVKIATNILGKYKNLHWQFQNEWRYIFTAFPYDVKQLINIGEVYLQLQNNKLFTGNLKQPFPYYDIALAEDAYENMEITASPKISKGNEVILNTLVNTFNASATIKRSVLEGKI